MRDELEELRDKILTSPGVQTAGFIVDGTVDRRKDVTLRAKEIEDETGVNISLCSFDEWIMLQTKGFTEEDIYEIGSHWMMAVVESFAQRKTEIAPIDEPCDGWVSDLIDRLK